MPPFTAGFWSFSLAKSVMTLAAADRILRDDETRRAAQALADEPALVHGAQRERVLDDDVLDVRLAQAAAELRHPLHVQPGEVGVVERRGALDLRLSARRRAALSRCASSLSHR